MEFMTWKKDIATLLQVPEERMRTLALLNLVAPSTSLVGAYDLYGTLARARSWRASTRTWWRSSRPQFAYKKGQLYLAS
eukprot:4838891-Lingulodinium_polyedra.AAC.1